jgi:hypothetical protein
MARGGITLRCTTPRSTAIRDQAAGSQRQRKVRAKKASRQLQSSPGHVEEPCDERAGGKRPKTKKRHRSPSNDEDGVPPDAPAPDSHNTSDAGDVPTEVLASVDMMATPSFAQLAPFEKDAEVAQLLHAYNTGSHRFWHRLPTPDEDPAMAADAWETAEAVPAGARAMVDEIRANVVTVQQKSACLTRFEAAINHESRLMSCGSCGVRKYAADVGKEYPLRAIADLGFLRLNDVTAAEHERLGRFGNVMSVLRSKDGFKYHLHPELMETDSGGGEFIRICARCSGSIDDKVAPWGSIVSGVDYGDPRRIGLGELSIVEWQLLSKCRTYATAVELRAPAPGMPQQHGLVGHTIAFPHDGAQAAADFVFPRVEDIPQLIRVQFLGSEGQRDACMDGLLRSQLLRSSSVTVYNYLEMLCAINPYYYGVKVDRSDSMAEAIDGLSRLLLMTANVVSDPVTLAMERQVGSDIANVREQNSDVLFDDGVVEEDVPVGLRAGGGCDMGDDGQALPATGDAPGELTLLVDHVLVTSVDGGAGATDDVDVAVLQRIQEAFRGPSAAAHAPEPTAVHNPTNPPEPPPSVTATRGARPMDEYHNFKDMCHGSFPQLFVLGCGLKGDGTPSPSEVEHMLYQFTDHFSTCMPFLDVMFNVKVRHAAARAVGARVRSSTASFQAFSEAVADPNFVHLVDEAVKNPKGDAAKVVLARVGPHMRVCGQNVPYSPIERRESAVNLYGLVQNYGLPSMFLTISLDDAHSPLVLRMCFPSTDNLSFPSSVDEFLDVLRAGQSRYGAIRIDNQQLHRYLAANPVAAARMFKDTMEAVFAMLLGVPVDYKTRKSVPFDQGPSGAFGHLTAALSNAEAQGRGTLHGHMPAFGSLPPSLLQKVGSYPALVKQVAVALDSMLSAELSKVEHVKGMVRRCNRVRTPHGALDMSPDPAKEPAAFQQRVATIVDACQLHVTHHITCMREEGTPCRMAKPSGLAITTGVVQLTCEPGESRQGASGKVVDRVVVLPEIVAEDYERTWDRDMHVSPVCPMDTRALYWQLQRTAISTDLNSDLPADVVASVEALGPVQRIKLIGELLRRNGAVVDYNDVVTSALGCNTAAYMLGSAEQGVATLFYLVKYVSKNPVELAHCLSIIREARNHITKFPSEAPDAGTVERFGRQFMQRVLNNFFRKMEVSSQQMAAALIGMPSTMCSVGFTYVFIWPAVAFVVKRDRELRGGDGDTEDDIGVGDHSGNVDTGDGGEGECSHADVPDDVDVDDSGRGQARCHDDSDSESDPGADFVQYLVGDAVDSNYSGSSTIYSKDGKRIPIPQHIHYAFRGHALRHLTLDEYPCIISVVPIKAKKAAPAAESALAAGADDAELDVDVEDDVADEEDVVEGAEEEEEEPGAEDQAPPKKRSRGRSRNARFPFDPGHPAADTHEQQLSSKQRCSLLGGGKPPPYPGVRPDSPSPTWQEQADAYARYMLVLMKPWSIDTHSVGPLTWDAFCEYAEALERGEPGSDGPNFMGKYRTTRIRNITWSLKSDAQRAWMLRSYRRRDAKILTRHCLGRTSAGTGSVDSATLSDTAAAAAAKEIDILRKRHQADEGGIAKPAALLALLRKKAYCNNSMEAVEEAFHITNGAAVSEAHATGTTIGGGGSATPSEVVFVPSSASLVKDVIAALRRDGVDDEDSGTESEGSQEPAVCHRGATSNMPASTTDPPVLMNAGQEACMAKVTEYLTGLLAWKLAGCKGLAPNPLRLLVHGGPGVGKTFFTTTMVGRATAMGCRISCTAFTGVAASNLPRALTIHSMFAIPTSDGRSGEGTVAYHRELPPLQKDRLVLMRTQLHATDIVLIDEISTVSPSMLAWVHQRLCEVSGRNVSFGGYAIIVLGDFYQMPPTVPSTSLYDAIMDLSGASVASGRPKSFVKYTEGHPGYTGAFLFREFRMFELTEQMRAAEDVAQLALVTNIRNPDVLYPITREVIKHLIALSADDVSSEPGWAVAPIVVSSNEERASLTAPQALRFAQHQGEVLIRWRLDLRADPVIADLSCEEMDQLFESEPSLWGLYVCGAPGFLTKNIKADKGLANGTPCVMESLTFSTDPKDKALVRQAMDLIAAARPGDVVTLPIAPKTVNVRIPGIEAATWPASSSLVPGQVVIPVEKQTTWQTTTALHVGSHSPHQVSAKPHGVELGFAITFHKVQGKTLARVILDLNKRPFTPSVSFSALYVAITRVRRNADMRVLKPQPGGNLDHLMKLAPSINLRAWLCGFRTPTGIWDQRLAKEAHEHLTTSFAAANRKDGKGAGKKKGKDARGGNRDKPPAINPAPGPMLPSVRPPAGRTVPEVPSSSPAPSTPQTQRTQRSASQLDSATRLPPPGAIHPANPAHPLFPSGLENRGNTCFINSVMQVIENPSVFALC